MRAVAGPSPLRRIDRHAVVVGHRGASARVPENTLPAFRAAWDAGAAWVEADTQPTADGVPVILHDADLDRTTSGSGPVRARTAAELAALEVTGLPGATVPTVAALLALLNPARRVLLEIKGPHTADQLAGIIRCCRDSGCDDRVFLQSFEIPVLMLIAGLAPARPFGLLVDRLDADPVARCRELGATAYHPRARNLIEHPGVVPVLRAAGITVAAWTADGPADWARLTAAGVDAIITNTPAELLAWQAERR